MDLVLNENWFNVSGGFVLVTKNREPIKNDWVYSDGILGRYIVSEDEYIHLKGLDGGQESRLHDTCLKVIGSTFLMEGIPIIVIKEPTFTIQDIEQVIKTISADATSHTDDTDETCCPYDNAEYRDIVDLDDVVLHFNNLFNRHMVVPTKKQAFQEDGRKIDYAFQHDDYVLDVLDIKPHPKHFWGRVEVNN